MHNIVTSGVGLFGPNMRVATVPEICIVNVNFPEALPRNNISSKTCGTKIVRTEPESDGAGLVGKIKEPQRLVRSRQGRRSIEFSKEEVKAERSPVIQDAGLRFVAFWRAAVSFHTADGIRIGRLSLHFVIIELSVSSYVQKQKMLPKI